MACRAQELGHLLHDRPTFHRHKERGQLKSRHLFVPAALELLRDASELGASAARWMHHRWSVGWRKALFVCIYFLMMWTPSTWNGASQTRLGPAEPSPDWSQRVSVINAKMGHGSHGVL